MRALLSLFILLPLYVQGNETYTFCYDPYPPYTLGQTGKTTSGLKVKVLDAVFSEIDSANAEVVLLPWKRCQNN